MKPLRLLNVGDNTTIHRPGTPIHRASCKVIGIRLGYAPLTDRLTVVCKGGNINLIRTQLTPIHPGCGLGRWTMPRLILHDWNVTVSWADVGWQPRQEAV